MGKAKRERMLSETEAQAVARNLRVSPQKLNLVAQMIRGKKVDTALADLEFSRKRIAKDVRKCVMSAVANAENNHGLDVNDLVVTQAHVGKNLVITRFHARGRGRMSPIEKPFAQLTVVVKEVARAKKKLHRQGQTASRRKRRRPRNGSQGQSGRASRRHQPHVGQPLVRQPRRVRQAAARGHAHPRSHPEAAPRRPASPRW